MTIARIYGRVSTKDQVSTSAQIDDIRNELNRLGVSIQSIIEEKKSAKDKDDIFVPEAYMKQRPGFYKGCFLPAKNREYDQLWVWKWDRFARSDFLPVMIRMFNHYGVDVIALKDSNEAIIRDIQGVLGKEEIRKIKERVDLRHNELVAQGKLINRLPFGYIPVKKTVDGKVKVVRWKIDSKKAEIVRRIHSLAQNKTVQEVSKEVGMAYSSVKEIIHNKAYFGIQRYKGKEYVCNDYEPILP